MIKRILVICLTAALCIPCLGVLVFADTDYSFVTTVESDGMAFYSGILPEGTYYLSGSGTLAGTAFSFENEPVTVSYFDSGDGLMSMCFIESFVIDGQSPYFVCLQLNGDTILCFGSDLGPALGTFTLSGVSSPGAPEPVYIWHNNDSYSGYRFPPAGVYTVRVTYADQTVESVVEMPQVDSYSMLYLPRFDVMPEGSNIYEGTCIWLFNLGTACNLIVGATVTEMPMEGAIVEFIPVSDYNGVPVLMNTIGAVLNSVVIFFGFVVNSLLAPGGAFSPLWPLIGLAVAFVLVPAGVDLIRRFSP